MALKYWTDFFDELSLVRGRSLNTVQAYRRDLEVFDEFLQTGKPLSGIYRYLENKGLSTRSQARVISSIRSYYKYCDRQGDKIPDLSQLRPPKVRASLPDPVDLEDFEKILKASVVEGHLEKTSRNQLTLLLLFGLGCRVTELTGLNLQDFYELDSWLKVKGKGGKERVLPLTEAIMEPLKHYLSQARPSLVRENTHALLVNDRGRRPSRIDVWRWLNAWSKKAGFTKTISPHQFRHGCATSLLQGGADLRSIQKLLGHSSIQTTQVYTSVTSPQLQEAVDEHHLFSNMELNVPADTDSEK